MCIATFRVGWLIGHVLYMTCMNWWCISWSWRWHQIHQFPGPKIGLRGTLQTHSKKVGLTHSELVGFGIGFGEILEWVWVVGLLWWSYENFGVPPPTINTHSFWVGLTHFFRVGLEGASGVPRSHIFKSKKWWVSLIFKFNWGTVNSCGFVLKKGPSRSRPSGPPYPLFESGSN